MRHKPNTSLKSNLGKIPFECIFEENMHKLLRLVIYDSKFKELSDKDINLQIREENIDRYLR
jgi:hypothetical protein